jgi:hypothetical protein
MTTTNPQYPTKNGAPPVTSPPSESKPREFGSFLLEQARGRTHDELSQALQDVTRKVIETGKKGSLTLVLNIALLDKDPANGLVITDEIKTKLPEHDRPASMFFPTSDGNLSRRDPRQMSFDDLATIPEPEGLNRVTGEIPRSNGEA